MKPDNLSFLDGIKRFWPIVGSLVLLIANGAIIQYQMITANWQDIRERLIRVEETQKYILKEREKEYAQENK